MVKKFLDRFSRLDTIPACDRQTDRRTPGDTQYALCIFESRSNYLSGLRTCVPRKKRSLRLGNAKLQKWRTWELRFHASPPTLTAAFTHCANTRCFIITGSPVGYCRKQEFQTAIIKGLRKDCSAVVEGMQ